MQIKAIKWFFLHSAVHYAVITHGKKKLMRAVCFSLMKNSWQIKADESCLFFINFQNNTWDILLFGLLLATFGVKDFHLVFKGGRGEEGGGGGVS